MGEAPPPQKEYILVITPFEEPTEALDDIRRKHPNVEIKIIRQTFLLSGSWALNEIKVPDGISPNAMYQSMAYNYVDEYRKATILATSRVLPEPKQAPNLKFIHFFSAGTDHVTNTPIYKDSEVILTTSSGIHGPQIAEWVLMQLLAFNHHEKQLLAFQREHKWGKLNGMWSIRDYVGQRLGVLGYGSIGRQSKL